MLQFVEGLENIWGSTNATIDFIVVGPVDNELHLSTSEFNSSWGCNEAPVFTLNIKTIVYIH